MAPSRISVTQLAQEAGVDLDEALIALWDAGFDEVTGPNDVLPAGEANHARRALGLATRRELASPAYWQERLQVDANGLRQLLLSIGVDDYDGGGRLRKRALHRLRAEDRRRGRSLVQEAPRPTEDKIATVPPLQWESVGHPREMTMVAPDTVLAIHKTLVEDFAASDDPITPSGLRSNDLLASACFRPFTSSGTERKYPTVEMSAAALLHALVHDHPFHNGNKRTALVSMLVFMDENGLVLTCDEDELFKLVLQLAQHALVDGPSHEIADRETLHVARWLTSHARWVEKGDRPMQWRRLRRILGRFGCTFENPAGVMNIARSVVRPARGIFGREKKEILWSHTAYGGDGREVGKSTIKKIRNDLELDDVHGVDSRAFYDSEPMAASEFIMKYRKTISRLARL